MSYVQIIDENLKKVSWAFRKVASGDKTIQVKTATGKSNKPRPATHWQGNLLGEVPVSMSRKLDSVSNVVTSETLGKGYHGTRQVFASEDIPAGTLLLEVPVFMAHANAKGESNDTDFERINQDCLLSRQNRTEAEEEHDMVEGFKRDTIKRQAEARAKVLFQVWKMAGASGQKRAGAIIKADPGSYGTTALTSAEYKEAEPATGTTDEAPDMPAQAASK